MNLTDDDLSRLWIGAFRYYCGRMTISTHSFCNSIIVNWSQIPDQAKEVIKRDLFEEIQRDDRDREKNREHKALGHDIDSKMWREVFAAIDNLN